MDDKNIRHKVINLLKLSTAAFIENSKRDKNEKNSISRSNVYLEEFSTLLTTPKYIETVNKIVVARQTKLKACDLVKKRQCAGLYDISCKNNEVTDENVQQLMKPTTSILQVSNHINFEKDFNSILDSIEDSQDTSQPDLNSVMNVNKPPNKGVSSKFFGSTSRKSPNTNKRSLSVKKSSLQQTNQRFNNPFKKQKIDHTDLIFSQNPKDSKKAKSDDYWSVSDSIKKFENISRKLEKPDPKSDDDDDLQSYALIKRNSYKESSKRKLGNSNEKFVNPWKMEKDQNAVIKKDSKIQEAPKSTSILNHLDEKVTKVVETEKSRKVSSCLENRDPDMDACKSRNDIENKPNPFASFKTAKQELEWQKNLQKRPPQKGLTKKRAINEHIPNNEIDALKKKFNCPSYPKAQNNKKVEEENNEEVHEELKGFDKEILKRIQREIVIDSKEVSWDDIIGLEGAKKVIKESVILSIRRPDLFTGLRESSRAIMLFGPPGTGKTLIGKCIASSCDATFMSVSASSLTSKWIGESETLVRAMFSYAKIKQPCVIFFDEIDSLLEKRSEQGNETFNRIKTEFLVQLDGANSLKDTDKVLLIGATNRPDVLDEAILRRFTKRIIVPLPVKEARANMFKHLLSKHCHTLTDSQIEKLADICDKYSGSDISQVCKEAAMIQLRRMDASKLESMNVKDIPPISPRDFVRALKNVKPTVSQETIDKLEEWNSKFGSTVDTNDNDETDIFGDEFDDL